MTMSEADRFRLRRDDALFTFIDVQERFVPTIHDIDRVVARAAILARAATVLEVPVLVTRQYPKGLGDTVPALQAALPPHEPIDKTAFSCRRDEGYRGRLEASSRRSVVVAGIEAHVCVLQTTLDLLADGWKVWIAVDAVGSRTTFDRDLGLRQMEAAGAALASTEMLLFQLLGDAKAPGFREVQGLVK
jgi:nicotinamidase-related amidase